MPINAHLHEYVHTIVVNGEVFIFYLYFYFSRDKCVIFVVVATKYENVFELPLAYTRVKEKNMSTS